MDARAGWRTHGEAFARRGGYEGRRRAGHRTQGALGTQGGVRAGRQLCGTADTRAAGYAGRRSRLVRRGVCAWRPVRGASGTRGGVRAAQRTHTGDAGARTRGARVGARGSGLAERWPKPVPSLKERVNRIRGSGGAVHPVGKPVVVGVPATRDRVVPQGTAFSRTGRALGGVCGDGGVSHSAQRCVVPSMKTGRFWRAE